MRLRLLAYCTVVTACGGDFDNTLAIEKVTPDYAPLSGGTRVVIEGEGFLFGGAPPNRVVIGDTEAPLAAAIDDGALEVVVPPGKEAGDVPILLFNHNGTVIATGVFHYSTAPTIDTVSPGEVVFDQETTVTVTGSGFLDEEAGVVTVLVDGIPAIDVDVQSDTTLTFTPRPGGVPFSSANVEILNARGIAVEERAFRFAPIKDPAFVLLTRNSGAIFTIVYDPVNDVRVEIPTVQPTGAFKVLVRDANGDFFAINRFQNQFGRLDFSTQVVGDPIQLTFGPNTMVRLGNAVFAYEKNNGARLGTFDPTSGSFTPISTGLLNPGPCCGQQQPGGTALGTNGVDLLFSNGATLSTVDKTTGAPVTTVNLNPQRHIRGIRQIGTTLFGIESNGTVFSINPANGATTNVEALGTQVLAVDLFTPAN